MLELTTDQQTDRQRNKQTNKQTGQKNNMPRYFDRKGGGDKTTKKETKQMEVLNNGYYHGLSLQYKHIFKIKGNQRSTVLLGFHCVGKRSYYPLSRQKITSQVWKYFRINLVKEGPPSKENFIFGSG